MNVSFIILHAGLHNQIIFSVTDNSAMQNRYNISKLIRVISSITITLEFLLWYIVLSTFTS